MKLLNPLLDLTQDDIDINNDKKRAQRNPRFSENILASTYTNHQINRNKLFNVSFMSAQSKHD